LPDESEGALMCAWFNTTQAGLKAKQAVHSKRRRARVQAATPEGADRIDLDDVYARDRVTGCCICKLPVPREQASLEHEIALANGGAHTLENVKLAHKSCNSAKGDRVGPRKKGLRRTAFKRRDPEPLPTHDEDGEEIW
jgi:5-methylcytosine-specific restriction endonuclease McrA